MVSVFEIVRPKFEVVSTTIGWTLLNLSLAFIVDAIWGKGPKSWQNLLKLDWSTKKDLLFWTLYISSIGGALAYLTPPGWMSISFIKYVQPYLPFSGEFAKWGWPILGGLIGLVVYDFVHYWSHRFHHTIPFLWRFHAIHHEADKMCLLTGNRVALTEAAFNVLSAHVIISLLGLHTSTTLVIVLIRQFIDIVQHSNLSWTYGKLGYVFASPINHYLHHSVEKEDWDLNYGNILSIWDHIFGTQNPKMKEINSRWAFDGRPKLGIPEGSKNFDNKFLSLPIIEDFAIWIVTFLKLKLWARVFKIFQK